MIAVFFEIEDPEEEHHLNFSFNRVDYKINETDIWLDYTEIPLFNCSESKRDEALEADLYFGI